MSEYHKIQTVYKRDPKTNHRTLIDGEFSLPEFDYLAGCEWVFTEKVDGTNIRIIITPEDVRFGGRTDNAQIQVPLLNQLQDIFLRNQSYLHAMFKDGAVLYGEGFGAGIQKGGGNYSQTPDFVLFDVRVGEWWLQRNDVVDIARTLNIEVVPEIERGTLWDMIVTGKPSP